MGHAIYRIYRPVVLSQPSQQVGLQVQATRQAEEDNSRDSMRAKLDDADLRSVLGVETLSAPKIELVQDDHSHGRHPEELFGERVRRKVLSSAADADLVAEQENRRRLESLAGQLNRVSSEQTIDEMALKFQQWLGTKRRAEKPAAGLVGGDFDYATAQYHDVKREKSEEGTYRYTAVLIDAQGRTTEAELEGPEGESAYGTMQLLKSNPLAELVYRRILMSVLDKLIQDRANLPENSK